MRLFELLKDARLPEILVVAGLGFLLLALVSTIKGWITMPPQRQKASATLGATLLLLGVLIFLIPALTAEPERHRSGPQPRDQTYAEIGDFFYPSGWMGDGELPDAEKYIDFDDGFTANCRTPPACMRVAWTPGPKGWAGIYWQHPDGNWGASPGCDLTGARSVTFWARGEHGQESVMFEAALTGAGSKVRGGSRKLSDSWQHYDISLEGESVTNVVGAFAWIARRAQNPRGATFYIDDLQIQGLKPEEVTCP